MSISLELPKGLQDKLQKLILEYYPNTQAIYILGSRNPGWIPEGEVEIGVLLPEEEATAVRTKANTFISDRGDLIGDIADLTEGKPTVFLCNLRDETFAPQKGLAGAIETRSDICRIDKLAEKAWLKKWDK